MRPSRRRSTPQPPRRPRVAGQHRRPDELTDTGTTEPKPKSRPAGTGRSTGVVPHTADDLAGRKTGRVTDTTEDDDATAEADTEDTTDRKRGIGALLSGMNLGILLAVLAVGLAVLAFWFRSEAGEAESGGSNVALTDNANTAEVSGQVRDAVNTIFSYSYTDIAKTTNAAKNLLIGDAVGQYDQVMQKFTKDIEAQRIQVTVTTVKTGVVSLSEDHARVLVFADQIAVRAQQQPTGGPTQFVVEVQRQDGRWKIVGFDFFDGGQPR